MYMYNYLWIVNLFYSMVLELSLYGEKRADKIWFSLNKKKSLQHWQKVYFRDRFRGECHHPEVRCDMSNFPLKTVDHLITVIVLITIVIK